MSSETSPATSPPGGSPTIEDKKMGSSKKKEEDKSPESPRKKKKELSHSKESMKERKAQRKEKKQEKKERKNERKELKKTEHEQFEFIEAAPPTSAKKKERKHGKKVQKKEQKKVYDFTKDNKEVGAQKVTRREIKQAKGPSRGRVVEPGDKAPRTDLEDFLLRFPVKRLRGTTWQYLTVSNDVASSSAREVMVLLGGGGLRPEAFWDQLELLGNDFMVYAPLLPPELDEFDDYVAGLNLVLAKAKIKRFHLYGVALGGMIAQFYASLYPERLLSLVLSHTPPPSAEFGKVCGRYREKKQKGKEPPPSSVQRLLMGWMVRSKELARDVPEMLSSSDGSLEFWKKVIKRFTVTPEDINSRLRAVEDHCANTDYTPGTTFSDLKCPVLLMESERTEDFGRRGGELQQKLFPDAKTVFFDGHGHMLVLIQGQDCANRILKFLTKNYWAKGGDGATATALAAEKKPEKQARFAE